jgi:hypothetical protein
LNGVAAAEHKAPTAAAAAAGQWQSRCKPQLSVVVAVVFLLLPALQAYLDPPEIFWQTLMAACESSCNVFERL